MNTVTKIYLRAWRPGLLVLSLALIAYVLYFHRLGTLLPGYSAAERSAYISAVNWHSIAHNPVNAPYKALVWLLTAVAHHGIFMTRVVSASFGVLAVLLFFAIIRPWYSYRIAFFATLLFATSAGFLHVARLGTAQVLQMSVLLLVAVIVWYRRAKKHRILIGYAAASLFALLVYVPGMAWFELFGVVLLWPTVRRQLQGLHKVHLAGWSALFIAVIAPLAVASIHRPHTLLIAGGLPQNLHSLTHVGSGLLNAVLSIGIRSNGDPAMWVGHTPLLDAAELVLGALGCYYYLAQHRTIRATFLTGSVIISVALISLGGSVGFAALIPLLYLFIAHGLSSLLDQWFTIFPRNPIARGAGIAVLCLMLFFSVLYQTRIYFVAWPHTMAARQTFNLTQP